MHCSSFQPDLFCLPLGKNSYAFVAVCPWPHSKFSISSYASHWRTSLYVRAKRSALAAWATPAHNYKKLDV